MGRLFLVELKGKIYSCKSCPTHLASGDDLLFRSFHLHWGKIYFFDSVSNVTYGTQEERAMRSGKHTVADMYCCCCGQYVGLKYVAGPSLIMFCVPPQEPDSNPQEQEAKIDETDAEMEEGEGEDEMRVNQLEDEIEMQQEHIQRIQQMHEEHTQRIEQMQQEHAQRMQQMQERMQQMQEQMDEQIDRIFRAPD